MGNKIKLTDTSGSRFQKKPKLNQTELSSNGTSLTIQSPEFSGPISGGGSSTPGGINGSIQIKNNDSLIGSSGFTIDSNFDFNVGQGNETSNNYGSVIIGGGYLGSFVGDPGFGVFSNTTGHTVTDSISSVIIGGGILNLPKYGLTLGVSNSIISGSSDSIFGSLSTSIKSTALSSIDSSLFSSIYGSTQSSIQSSDYVYISGGSNSSIIGSGAGSISHCSSESVLAGVRGTCVYDSNGSSIIGGSGHKIKNASECSIILGGQNNFMYDSCNSSIISGKGNLMQSSKCSSIIGGSNLTLNGLDNTLLVQHLLVSGNTEMFGGLTSHGKLSSEASNVILKNLPISDPGIAGQLFLTATTFGNLIAISQG